MRKKPKTIHKIHMTYSEDRKENDDPIASKVSYTTFSPESLYVAEPSWSEEIEVLFDPQDHIGEEIFVVVVRYQSGSTFGVSYGNWCVEGAYLTEDEAMAVENKIHSGKYTDYAPWTGYFERLEEIEIHGFHLKEAPTVPPKLSDSTKVIHHG